MNTKMTWTPDALVNNIASWGLTGHHLAVLHQLLSETTTADAFTTTQMSVEVLAKTLLWSIPKTRKYIKELEKAGIVNVNRSPPSLNVFDLSPMWAKLEALNPDLYSKESRLKIGNQ